MKFLYVSDLHGWEEGYNRVLDEAKAVGASAIVNGGDMWPKGGGIYEKQKKFLKGFLADHFKACGDAGISYLGMPGNDDLKARLKYWKRTIESRPSVHDISEGVVEFGGLFFGGIPYVPDVPFPLKDWCIHDREGDAPAPCDRICVESTDNGFSDITDIRQFLDARPIMEQLLHRYDGYDMDRFVLVSHCPPRGVHLASVAEGEGTKDVGSAAVCSWIEEKQPLLSLHGHLHENFDLEGRYVAKIGKTRCVQAGQYGPYFGEVVVTIVEIDNGKVSLERKVIGDGLSVPDSDKSRQDAGSASEKIMHLFGLMVETVNCYGGLAGTDREISVGTEMKDGKLSCITIGRTNAKRVKWLRAWMSGDGYPVTLSARGHHIRRARSSEEFENALVDYVKSPLYAREMQWAARNIN